ncbi:hypothetical protein [Streptomyces sp. NPDC000410]|uniref:hypothetical protein n=1 Tax=Streptomyces sp. NPDC000410 TaxID=3154254 RepID=UPI003318F946
MHSTRTRNVRSVVVAAAALGLTAGGITLGTSDVFEDERPSSDSIATVASQQKKVKGGSCWTLANNQVRNAKFVKTIKLWPNTPNYRSSGWGPNNTLTVDTKYEYSTKLSATFGATNGTFSAALGFDVTESWSRTQGFKAKLTKKAHYTLRVGEVYKQYRYDVYGERGFYNWHGDALVCQSYAKPDWAKKGSGTATRFWTLDHKLTKGRLAH